MQKIQLAWKNATKKRLRIYYVFIVAILLLISLAYMQDGEWNIGCLLLCSGIAAFICIVLSFALLSKKAFERALDKLLRHGCYGRVFQGTIDEELENALLAEFSDKHYRLQMYITDTWFVLISTNASVIRKWEEICGVESYFNTQKSTFAVKLRFYDGDSWICSCNAVYATIIQLIQENMKGATL